MKKFSLLVFILGGFVILGAGCAVPSTPTTDTSKPIDTINSSTTKNYIQRGKDRCETLRFRCEVGQKPFFDDVGCGCEVDDALSDVCPATNKPVCGELEVQCIKAPCPPLKKTYSNRCLAEKENAQNISEGVCVETVGNEYIEVSHPQANEIISGNTVTIKARVLSPWLFEAVAPIEVTDQNGKILGNGKITGPNDWMTQNGWMQIDAQVGFKNNGSKKGFVVFRRDNPSGKPENDMMVKVPVQFEAANTSACTTQYEPVCGDYIQPQCIKAPCPPLRKTYSNRCEAEKVGAKNITSGKCQTEN
jgi:hypothetical protein